VNIQDTWLQILEEEEHKRFFASAKSEWINSELGCAWLKHIFDSETKENARTRWKFLILDSHGCHITMGFVEFREVYKFHLITYQPHSTHSLQPLDVENLRSLDLFPWLTANNWKQSYMPARASAHGMAGSYP
jgi:hypothetical protein